MCDKPSSACGCVSSFFSGYSRFRPTYRLILLDMSKKLERDVKLNIKKTRVKKMNFSSEPGHKALLLLHIKAMALQSAYPSSLVTFTHYKILGNTKNIAKTDLTYMCTG